MNKKADISLTMIIIAAIGLIVLVVIVSIFTGRMTLFNIGISKAAQTELASMKLDYGQCHPSKGMESIFLRELDKADEANKAAVISKFETAISSCKSQTTQDSCVAHTPSDFTGATCAWG